MGVIKLEKKEKKIIIVNYCSDPLLCKWELRNIWSRRLLEKWNILGKKTDRYHKQYYSVLYVLLHIIKSWKKVYILSYHSSISLRNLLQKNNSHHHQDVNQQISVGSNMKKTHKKLRKCFCGCFTPSQVEAGIQREQSHYSSCSSCVFRVFPYYSYLHFETEGRSTAIRETMMVSTYH